MRVILGQPSNSQQTIQFARLLVAVHGAELEQAHGQLAVAAALALVDLDVEGAVHRFDRIGAVLGLGNEHVLDELFRVTGFLPQLDVHHFGRIHFHVAVLAKLEAAALVSTGEVLHERRDTERCIAVLQVPHLGAGNRAAGADEAVHVPLARGIDGEVVRDPELMR